MFKEGFEPSGEPAGMEIEGFFRHEFPGGLLETRPVGEKYEMFLQIGETDEKIDLGRIDPAEAAELHGFAVALAEERKAGAGINAKTNVGYILGAVRSKLRHGNVH